MGPDTQSTQRAIPPDLQAARHAAAFSELDWLWLATIVGLRLTDLLNWLSTNDLRKLAAGEGLPSVLTSPVGPRHGLMLVYAGRESLQVRLMPGQAQRITLSVQHDLLPGRSRWPTDRDDRSVCAVWPAVRRPAGLPDRPARPHGGVRLARMARLRARTSAFIAGPLGAWEWTVVTDLTQQQEVQAALGSGAVQLGNRGSPSCCASRQASRPGAAS